MEDRPSGGVEDMREELAAIENEQVTLIRRALYVVGKATGVLADIPAGLYEWHVARKGTELES